MTEPLLTPPQILQATATFFGQPVQKLTAPGGRSRSTLRAYLPDRTVIVSQRRNEARAKLELMVLQQLMNATEHAPQVLGTSGTLVFQTDAGPNRLNWAVNAMPADQRMALAASAVEALFDIQRAGRRVGLHHCVPTGPIERHTDDDLLPMVTEFSKQLHLPVTFDSNSLSQLFRAAPDRFVKWDCRSGNAALGTDGRIRWFDFEDARLAHGPEDFAWLIADEVWPIEAASMLTLIRDRLTAEDTTDPKGYMVYLQEFATLQAIRRIRLIFRQAKSNGWLDRTRILKLDMVGANPHMGERLALRGADIARLSDSTTPLLPLFHAAVSLFRRVREPIDAVKKTE